MTDFSKRTTVSGPGLLIGIPTLGRPVPLEWATAYKSLSPPINYSINVITLKGKPVDVARNEIVEYALKLGVKYVFFLGDDVVVPSCTLKRFIFWMENHPEIGVVTGVYCSKSDPPAPLVFRENGKGSYWDWHVGEFFEITGCGMDCVLIRTDVFQKLSKPWFKTLDEDKFEQGINDALMYTEDLYFCKKLIEETEYKIYCDASVLCSHWDVYAGKEYLLPPDCLPSAHQVVAPGNKRAIDIGCGTIDRSSEFPEFTLTRVDIRDEVNPDYRCDVRNLPFGDKSYDVVFSSHVLEHFGRHEYRDVLREWVRLLKDDGELVLILPNIKWAFEHLGDKLADSLNVLYGAQSNPFDFHQNGFWPSMMEEELALLEFSRVDFDFKGYNMIIKARRK